MKKIREKFFRAYVRFFLRSYPNIWLGRIIFGNDGGIYSNLIGEYISWKNRVFSNPPQAKSNVVLDGSVSLKEKGYLINYNLVGSEIIDEISSQWDKYCSDKPVPVDGRFQLSSEEDASLMKKIFPSIEQCISEELQQIIESFYQANMNILNYHVYRIFGNEDNTNGSLYGSTATWHNDGSTSESLKLFFMLSDIQDLTDGPTAVLDIDQTKKLVRSKHFEFPDKLGLTASTINKEYSPKMMTGDKGTAFIARTNQCLHAATIPDKGKTRDLLVFYITSSTKKRNIKDQISHASYDQLLGLKRLFLN